MYALGIYRVDKNILSEKIKQKSVGGVHACRVFFSERIR